ncbi:peptidoglycan DD-metalloendopeptidase family protein [Croceiramulus getboli]|nr:peptidoglycan DD-metalloendopeptidase family protein [Flavobacteriaceae bacterium YJPT1-3]
MKDLIPFGLLVSLILLLSCNEDSELEPVPVDEAVAVKIDTVKAYGYVLDNYIVHRDTVRSGDSFGDILFKAHIDYPTITAISDSAKGVFDTRLIRVGKPYMILKSKDSLEKAQVFIYEQNQIDYVVLDFQDSIRVAAKKNPVTIVEKAIAGTITDNLSSAVTDLDASILVSYKLADIYAWTIDFFRLQEGDRFKVIYTEKYVNDTIYAGFDKIKAALFEHKGKPVYAFEYQNDSIPGKRDYFDETGKNLRRAFLKGPLQFNKVSSYYNLKRRIRYYGNRIRPHKGTDFAAPVGTAIMATADGTVTKSERRGGNGKYVKIRHNSTYETQYLHMSRQAVKVGEYVRQGDVIGYVGMTGNTSGPHVCYRFWKNGRQVDPFKEDLPETEPLEARFMPDFTEHMRPMKRTLDSLSYVESVL